MPFQAFNYERARLKLFQKLVLRTNLDIYGHKKTILIDQNNK